MPCNECCELDYTKFEYSTPVAEVNDRSTL